MRAKFKRSTNEQIRHDDRMGSAAANRWTEQQIIDRMRAWAALHGRAPKKREWYQGAHDEGTSQRGPADADYPHTNVVLAHFGTWNKAVIAAGLTPNRPHDERDTPAGVRPGRNRQMVTGRDAPDSNPR